MPASTSLPATGTEPMPNAPTTDTARRATNAIATGTPTRRRAALAARLPGGACTGVTMGQAGSSRSCAARVVAPSIKPTPGVDVEKSTVTIRPCVTARRRDSTGSASR